MVNIPISRPSFSDEEKVAVAKVIDSGWVTQGPEVQRFEEEFANYVGSKYAVAVSSATTALHLSLISLGVQAGSEVITVSHSFIATANPIRYVGAIPVFVDIDKDDLNISASELSQAINEKTAAVIIVHQLGFPADVRNLIQVADERGIPVIEDAACAIGASITVNGKRQLIGSPHGRLACFSFHPRKVVTTGDGGMITTNDSNIHEHLKYLRQHGMSVNDLERHASREVITESYLELGFNYRMTDIQAAVGRVQLKKLDGFLRDRSQIADRYIGSLPERFLSSSIYFKSWRTPNWQSFIIKCFDTAERDRLLRFLKVEGVFAKPAVMNIHQEPAYPRGVWLCRCSGCKRCSQAHCDRLSRSEDLRARGVLLPIYPGLSRKEQDFVTEKVAQFADV